MADYPGPINARGSEMRHLTEILKDRRGATAVEYGLILALIFLAMVVILVVRPTGLLGKEGYR